VPGSLPALRLEGGQAGPIGSGSAATVGERGRGYVTGSKLQGDVNTGNTVCRVAVSLDDPPSPGRRQNRSSSRLVRGHSVVSDVVSDPVQSVVTAALWAVTMHARRDVVTSAVNLGGADLLTTSPTRD
jgi:hypothetical protein